ncbi:MAG: M23 family metallopeptidase, partial [Sandarakinorhabdus sp.]|nr:M23 family metallopeptidase [Sandarakinorhabdus sp.]
MTVRRLGIAAALLIAGCASNPKPVTPARAVVIAVPKPVPKPAWQARKVVADAVVTPQGRVHTVKPGETGIAIARAYGMPWDKVVAANRLKPPFVLEVGDRLLLPSARQVAALSPEERARAFSVDIDDIITGGEPANTPAIAPKSPVIPSPRPPRAPAQLPRTPPPAPVVGDTPPFRWPVEGRVLSSFGAKPGGRFNDGVNLKVSAGAPVRAACDGIVAYAGNAIPGFGNLVLIKHAGGWVTA